MRYILSAGIGLSALLVSSGMAHTQLPAPSRNVQPQPFCRNAAPLPILPIEVDRNRVQQQSLSSSHGRLRPPPPPPPVPPITPSTADAAMTAAAPPARSSVERAPGAPSSKHAPESRTLGDTTSATVAPMPPRPWPEPRPQPRPQSGMLTAGEYDDVLNPELYAAYTKRSNLGQAIPDLPYLDMTRLLTVEVKDRAGQPIAFADVKLICEDGNSLTMQTQADGRAIFFPALDRLSPRLTIQAAKSGQSLGAPRAALLSSDAGGQLIGITAPSVNGNSPKKALAQKAKALDLMLVIDTTGSMSDEIRYLQSELTAIVSSLVQRHRGLDVRVGFVFYRDEGDDYVTRTIDFDRNMGRANGVLARQSAQGGGDYPEAMDQALIRAMGAGWRPDAIKSLVLVADAPPHDDKFGRTWAAAEIARMKRIHITPVAASGVGDKAEYAMRAMAALTQSRYLFLTDDSGIGNSHAAPTVDCYLVTRLDALLRRVIDSQLSGQRVEPDKNEIIRSVGEYDRGKCILPADFRWQ